jgi:hypothetical protein
MPNLRAMLQEAYVIREKEHSRLGNQQFLQLTMLSKVRHRCLHETPCYTRVVWDQIESHPYSRSCANLTRQMPFSTGAVSILAWCDCSDLLGFIGKQSRLMTILTCSAGDTRATVIQRSHTWNRKSRSVRYFVFLLHRRNAHMTGKGGNELDTEFNEIPSVAAREARKDEGVENGRELLQGALDVSGL